MHWPTSHISQCRIAGLPAQSWMDRSTCLLRTAFVERTDPMSQLQKYDMIQYTIKHTDTHNNNNNNNKTKVANNKSTHQWFPWDVSFVFRGRVGYTQSASTHHPVYPVWCLSAPWHPQEPLTLVRRSLWRWAWTARKCGQLSLSSPHWPLTVTHHTSTETHPLESEYLNTNEMALSVTQNNFMLKDDSCETHSCHFICYSFRLAAKDLLSYQQDSIYHGACYTSCGTLAGMSGCSTTRVAKL